MSVAPSRALRIAAVRVRATAILRTARTGAAALGPLLLAGCLEFGDPLIPDVATPAVLFANVRIFDTGRLQIDGTLSPGRDDAGFLRVVQVPQLHVAGEAFAPDSVDERGVRRYDTVRIEPRDRTAESFEIVPPDVRGVGPLPTVLLHGLRSVGGDTIRLAAGSDIVLRVDSVPQPSVPAQRQRQWFIDVRSAGASFRLSGDGPLPAALRIPAEFVAASAGGRADVSLIYFQTAAVTDAAVSGAGVRYIGSVLLDVRLTWVVFFEAGA